MLSLSLSLLTHFLWENPCPKKPSGEAYLGKGQRPPANSHMSELRVDSPAPVKPSDDHIPGQGINCHPMRDLELEPPSKATPRITEP